MSIPDFDKKLNHYADIIVRVGLNLQPGQWLFINAPMLAAPLVHQIAMLKYREPEHTTRQIAEQLGIPHGTVTVKLMRFRAAVRRELACELLDAEEV